MYTRQPHVVHPTIVTKCSQTDVLLSKLSVSVSQKWSDLHQARPPVPLPDPDFNGFHRISIDFNGFNGFQWFSMVFNGFQWFSMVFNGFQNTCCQILVRYNGDRVWSAKSVVTNQCPTGTQPTPLCTPHSAQQFSLNKYVSRNIFILKQLAGLVVWRPVHKYNKVR